MVRWLFADSKLLVSGVSGVGTYQLVTLVVLFGAMYFLLIRPQQQRQKQHQQTVSALEPGQHIVTIGGLVAEIVDVRGDRLLLRVSDGSEMEYMKEAVGRVLREDELTGADLRAELADEERSESAPGSEQEPGPVDGEDAE